MLIDVRELLDEADDDEVDVQQLALLDVLDNEIIDERDVLQDDEVEDDIVELDVMLFVEVTIMVELDELDYVAIYLEHLHDTQ